MDFLPGSRGDGTISIPFVADDSDTSSLLDAWNCAVDYLPNVMESSVTGTDWAATIQRSLFFGLLGVLLGGGEIDVKSLRTEMGEINTSLVRDLIAKASHKIQGKLRGDAQLEPHEIADILNRTGNAMRYVETGLTRRKLKEQNADVVFASVRVLLSYFVAINQNVEEQLRMHQQTSFGRIARRFRPDPLARSLTLSFSAWPMHWLTPGPSGSVLQENFLSRGWCPHQVRKIMRTFPHHIVNHFAMLQRHIPESVSHKDCSENKCEGWTMSGGELADFPKHVTSDCQCTMLQVSSEEVANIVRRGGIPIISIQRDWNGRYYLKLRRRRR